MANQERTAQLTAEQKEEIVIAEKGGRRTEFTRYVWDTMGKDKNGWSEVVDVDVKSAENDQTNEKEYQKLIKEANKAEKEKKEDILKAKLQAAYALRPTPLVAERLGKLGVVVLNTATDAISQNDANFNELVKSGDDAYNKQQYDVAFEMYGGALEIKEDEAIRTKYKECEGKL